MLLNELISSITYEELRGDDHKKISSITPDSRQVVPGSLFVAISGPVADGHTFIGQALNNGAVAVVCEKIPDKASAGITWIRVKNSAVAMGHLASQWYGNPSRKLTLVGVTGTNGKTTTATLLYEMAQLQGKKAGLLSTVENRVDKKVYVAHNTTPSPLEINKLLAEMVDCGCTFAAMEVSSHGMVQNRTAGLHFAGGIFTNLTRDHLDYHKTVEAYLKAKKSFFDQLPASAFALTNADDANGFVMLQNTAAKKASYSLRTDADFHCRVIESRIDGMLLRLNGIEVETQFAGRFNAYNLSAVYGAMVLLGNDPHDTAVALSQLVPVAGRFQTFTSADGVTAIVDYAHTPDALSNVLSTIADVVGKRGSITTVTGAGGNRDHGKRPQMGAEAARRSQRVIITSDNPRDENPEDIADDIKAGIPVDSEAKVDIIIERAAAIHVAITEANPGDVILVAGKGHEDYQEFENHRRIHFDDREQVRRAIDARNQQSN
jgi:UDP-N-acetylmuramoyl-L-alanyl-D-glutamate--2,6-diaminopimelate ligase